MNFCKERGQCCLLCLMFWMLLTSAATTLILLTTFSMIEFKSLQMLMDSKAPIHKHLQIHTQTITNTTTHTKSLGRALSVDELTWSQTLWLSYSISCKRWIRVLYNYSHTEAQCNKLCVRVRVPRCVWGCAREERLHLKVAGYTQLHTVPPLSWMWYVYSCKLPTSARGLEECALIETTGTAYTAL